ncbi:hypothetical protein PR003_g1050 [Phytophthora rubi]|uniref:RING-type domain-containing protein n=1 Tax=Phytophthora rubi TaxID=129364 RepID=A0A6A4G1N7_9STRA|nr:hypothetical protein PR002_g10284 [Phytophthora rubi]KAE9033878.1 hypothetical protein PR001_g9967 [Phytophthora rubi]KAE9358809.1 hypothetical protein PR003_g1050 [Phytophthora rubi]
MVLSSTNVPLQCCEKVVSNDYIRDVLAPEENTYYLFLVSQPRTSVDVGKATSPTPAMTTTAGSLPAMDSSGARNTDSDFEKKPPPNTLLLLQTDVSEAIATATAEIGQVNSTLDIASAPPPEPRYLTRSSKARLAKQQTASQGGAVATSVLTSTDQASVTSSREKLCTCRGPSMVKAPCGHGICRKCLETGARRCLDMAPQGNVVPVSCCNKVLQLDLVSPILSEQEWTMYAKLMYSNATTPSTVGSKRKAAPEKKPAAVSQRAKGKAPAKRAKKTDDSKRECIACFSEVLPAKLHVGPCGHGYCPPCLKKMAKMSLSNRDQVPVRCCSMELPVEYVKSVLTKTQFDQYQRYVSERDPKTSTLKSDQDYAAVVRKNKGKQCPVCGIGVVKVAGCHAMRCSLGHGFCWNCLQSICTCGRIYQYN